MAHHRNTIGNSVPLNCPCAAHSTGMWHAMTLVPKNGRHYLFASVWACFRRFVCFLWLLAPQLRECHGDRDDDDDDDGGGDDDDEDDDDDGDYYDDDDD